MTFLERGAIVETDILANIKVLLPPDVTKQLDELIPPPPSSQTTEVVVEPEEMPTVIYTADAVLENQIGEQKDALDPVSTLHQSHADAHSQTGEVLRGYGDRSSDHCRIMMLQQL